MILECILPNFKLILRSNICINSEQTLPTLDILIILMFLLHSLFILHRASFSFCISLYVVILSFLDDGFGYEFGTCRIIDSISCHYLLIITHFDLGRLWCLQPQFHLLLLFLFFFQFFGADNSLFLLICKVDRSHHLVDILLLVILDRHWVLYIMSYFGRM